MPKHPTPADILHHILTAVSDFDDREMSAGRMPTHAMTRQLVQEGVRRANAEQAGRA